MPAPSAATAPEDSLVQTKSAHDVRRMFHDISPTYDFLNHLLSFNTDKRWRRIVARHTVTSGVSRILDCCSGTGDLAIALGERAAKLGAKPLIVGSDFTASMMTRAKGKFAASVGAPKPSVGDTMHLPFPGNQFDLVTVAFGIRNVNDFSAGLREMARVCRPGGKVAVLEFSHPRNRLFSALYNFYFFNVLPWIGYLMTGTRAYRYLPKSVAKFPEGEEFATVLSEATGGVTNRIPLTFGVATLYISEKKKS
ncbi:MAG: ubiquinone/menaquinone biosynthesis methyltransferase [Candidatus Sumerlaeaceae bacterium]|nr:ubiquinone/menaquinone biosynthesis methyltransferase [Candidatus Sumerlaeaceae bacterium]